MQSFNKRIASALLLSIAFLLSITMKAQNDSVVINKQNNSVGTMSTNIASPPSGCSLTGTTTVTAGSSYYYRLSCSGGSSAARWSVSCGTTLSSDIDIIQVQWTGGCGSGLVKAIASDGTVLASLAVTINQPLSPGTITNSSQTINYNTAPAQINATAASGGLCGTSYSYQWQSCTDNVNFADISGATSQNHAPGYLATTTYFRRRVSCSSDILYTNTAVVTVYPLLQGGTVNPSDQYFNYNSDPGTLMLSAVSGGSGSYTYQWQQYISGPDYVDIPGATGLSYAPGLLTATHYYRVAVTSNGVTAYSTRGMVWIYPPLQPGSVTPSSQTINYSSVPSTFNITGVSGGNGSYGYQWQISTDNINFGNVSGATAASYAPGPLTTTTHYRVVVSSNGITLNSASCVVIVNPPPPLVAGSISGNTGPLNYNTSPGILNGTSATGGVCSSYSYQWQQSIDGGYNYTDIADATNQSYTPGSLTIATSYRRKVNCGNETVYSNVLTVTVNQQLLGGTITPDFLVIGTGTAPGSLVANPAGGGNCASYSYQWQQSTDGITFTDISGATNQNYTPPTLTTTTYYRRSVSCGTETAYTNISTITVGAVVTFDLNYIRSRDVTTPGVLNITTAQNLTDLFDIKQSTQYFDGLGRLSQTVSKQTSPLGKDMVAPVTYDAFGREVTKYLPYVSSAGDGQYRINPLPEQNSFNGSQFVGEQFYYGQTDYEPSPLNRELTSYAAGQSWVGSNRGGKIKYASNTIRDDVKIWRVTDVLNDWGNYSINGSYQPGELSKNITIDEKGSQVIEFKDKQGRVVLKKIQLTAAADDGNGTGYPGWLSTYYIYDDLNQLRAVLQPRAVEILSNTSWQLTASLLDEFSFRYEYDRRQRMIMKKVPGAGEVWIVYDGRDRLVMMQDANQRAASKWLITEYDGQNRPARTGLLTDGNNRTYHQNLASASTAYPATTSNYEVLTETYYDDYNWVAGTGLSATIDNTYAGNSTYFITGYNASPVYAQPLTPDYMTHGQMTGTKTKVLGTSSQYLYTISFYDDRRRIIQTQAINITGGKDIVTTQYDFSGKPLRTLLQHQKNGPNSQTHLVLTKMSYDHAGRLLTVTKTINSTINGQTINKPEQIIVSNSYNELGQLRNKVDGAGIESLAYDYNIRGWLLGVNRNFVNDAASNYFGFDLGYDKQTSAVNGATYAGAQYAGNISGTIWKSKGDGEKRKYDFTYDNANRLTSADFNQQFGINWVKTDPNDQGNRIDFSVSNLTYDANGNIMTMQQQGWKPGGSTLIDDLTYAYNIGGNSNKLLAVTESPAIGNMDNKLGDFTDKNPTLDDYAYDNNGNLITDKNKKIASISYNHLNLPSTTSVNKDDNTLKGNITYTYDAAGNKLKKTVTDNAGGTTTTTLYLSGFEYKNDTLQQLGHEEGRVRYAKKYFYNGDSTYAYFYDYFLKDHLGNTRMVLTEQKDTTGYFATMETGVGNSIRNKENQLFSNIDGSSYLAANVPGGYPVDTSVTNPNLYVAKLNGSGQKIGPSVVLKVMSGDVIDVAVKSFYRSQGSAGANSNGLTDILSSLATGIVTVSGGTKGTLAQLSNNTTSPLLGGLNLFRSTNNSDPVGKPKAYLNWILLDERFNYVSSYPQSGALPVGNADALQTLAYSGINITKSGYLYIYVSNETQNWDVFFDNLAIKHYTGPILEETHYYPFGLTMAGVSSKSLEAPENKYKFNGIEFNSDLSINQYEAFYRNYNPQIGRWFSLDNKPNESISPYAYVDNNPILYFDPMGDTLNVQADEKSAGNQFVNLVNQGLGGFYDISVNPNGYAKLTKTNKKGEMTKEQKQFYNTMDDLINGKGQTQVFAVENDPLTLIGSFELQRIDVGDIKNASNEVVTSSSLLAHELVEQKSKQNKNKQFQEAHAEGIEAENRVSGAKRGELLPSDAAIDNIGNVNGTVKTEYTKNGIKYIYSNNITDNNVISNTITRMQPSVKKKK